MNEQSRLDLQAELDTLRERLSNLEAKHRDSLRSPSRSRYPVFSWRLLLGALPLVALLAAGGLLYGQGAADLALFIDPRGWVGIGTNQPNATLDVNGELNVRKNTNLSNATITESLKAGSLNVTKDTILANATITESLKAGMLEVTSNADLRKTTMNQLDINHVPRTNIEKHRTDIKGLYVTGDFAPDSGVEFRHSNGTQGIGFGFNTIYATGSLDNQPLQLKAKGTGLVNVLGAFEADKINGEKKPMVFEVGQKGDIQKWYSANIDIGPLCGDADGCTIKFFLRENDTDKVRTILEQMYIEQPDKSSNKTLGLSGMTHQLGTERTEFVLQTGTKNDLVPHPWDWIYVRNYSSSEVNQGRDSAAFGGYKVQFMTRPNVSATVIIYDR